MLISGSEKDTFKSVTTANLFDTPDLKEVRIDDYNFLPSLSIKPFNSETVDFDVHSGARFDPFGNMNIEANKLKNYVELVLSIRRRRNGKSDYY